MTELQQAEYEALRATIRQRGTLRLLLIWPVIAGWAALLAVVASSSELPVFSLLPLAMLAGGFEAINALHVNVERIGRYLQVFYEGPAADAGRPAWETTAMEYGRRFPKSGPDPLFANVFVIATILNFLTVAFRAVPVEMTALGAAHLLLPARMLIARRRSARQRAEDLGRFEEIRNG